MQTKISDKIFSWDALSYETKTGPCLTRKTSADFSADASYILILRTKLDSHFLQIL